jgi:hypothetical protein
LPLLPAGKLELQPIAPPDIPRPSFDLMVLGLTVPPRGWTALVTLPAKMKFHGSSFDERSREKPGGLELWRLLCAISLFILTVLMVALFKTRAGSLDWLFDAANNDDSARKQAEFFVWDGVSHPVSATFEKVNLVEKAGPFYLFHVVLNSPGAGGGRDHSSYLVCFKFTEERTDFRIVTVIQYASDPPTENEIAIDKRLNRWPLSPPWKAGDDIPHNIKPPGLSIVLDKSRAGLDQ